MTRKKEVSLEIELFSSGEDREFRIRSKREIQSILHAIAQENMRTALYYDDGKDFILTTALEVSEQGMWLDVGSIAASNQRILHSDEIIVISSHRQVKVQFVANRIENALFEDRPAFYLPLPDSLLRIQRREYFRLPAPAGAPLRCIIPVPPPADPDDTDDPEKLEKPEKLKKPDKPDTLMLKREATIMDLSGGGMALVCETEDAELQPGKIYEDCKIPLPGIGTISATVKVKNTFEVTLRNGLVSKRAGCEFVRLDGEANALLQRYVAYLQSEALIKS